RGEPYRLKLELVGSEQLSTESVAALAKAATAVGSLRNKLNLPAERQEIEWKPAQAEILAKELPALAAMSAGTPLSKLLTAAKRDLERQAGGNCAVATMQSRFVGTPVEEFTVSGTADYTIQAADLIDKVTVL